MESEINKLYGLKQQENENRMEYWKDGQGEQTYITFNDSKRFAKHILKKFKRGGDKTYYKVLDFGGGDGEIAYYVAEELIKKYSCERVEVTVVDYLDKLYVSRNEKITMRRVFPLEHIKQEMFDVVIASAVIEHLPSLKESLEILFSSLDMNGILYCRTPYVYPLYKILKKVGIEYDTWFPFHIWDLGKKWYEGLPKHLGCYDSVRLISSRPSIVQQTFRANFFCIIFVYDENTILYLPLVAFSWRMGSWLQKNKIIDLSYVGFLSHKYLY